MASKKKGRSGRAWLNTDHSQTAYVSYSISAYDGTLKIGDCNRIVHLDFAIDREGKVGKKSVAKLERFIRAVNEFYEGLVAQAAENK